MTTLVTQEATQASPGALASVAGTALQYAGAGADIPGRLFLIMGIPEALYYAACGTAMQKRPSGEKDPRDPRAHSKINLYRGLALEVGGTFTHDMGSAIKGEPISWLGRTTLSMLGGIWNTATGALSRPVTVQGQSGNMSSSPRTGESQWTTPPYGLTKGQKPAEPTSSSPRTGGGRTTPQVV